MNTDLNMLSTYDFDLPSELIAQSASLNKEDNKLLVRDRNSNLYHNKISDLVSLIPPHSLVIVNNSKVFPSRLFGKLVTGATVELLLLEEVHKPNSNSWLTFGKPMRKLTVGCKIFFDDNVTATVIKTSKDTGSVAPFEVEFDLSNKDFIHWLDQNGYVPLPPYIKRKDREDQLQHNDRQHYQTVYASQRGSVAAPTAGLHFTEALIEKMKQHNIEFANITLHVGAGTFLPVNKENINEHIMHSERFVVPKITLDKILSAQKNNREIIVVGTTSFRCLEALYKLSNKDVEQMYKNCDALLQTNLFIKPTSQRYIFKPWAATCLMTNFHQPKSTLFMLICALLGIEQVQPMYKLAVDNKYRFFSYGDACLLWL